MLFHSQIDLLWMLFMCLSSCGSVSGAACFQPAGTHGTFLVFISCFLSDMIKQMRLLDCEQKPNLKEEMWLPVHGCKATIQIYRYFSKHWSSQFLNYMKICHFLSDITQTFYFFFFFQSCLDLVVKKICCLNTCRCIFVFHFKRLFDCRKGRQTPKTPDPTFPCLPMFFKLAVCLQCRFSVKKQNWINDLSDITWVIFSDLTTVPQKQADHKLIISAECPCNRI